MRPQLIDGNPIYVLDGLEYNPSGSSLTGEYPKIVNGETVGSLHEEEALLGKKSKKADKTED